MQRVLSRYESEVVEFFSSEPTEKVKKCPLCSSTNFIHLFKKKPKMNIVRCQCDFIFNSTPPTQEALDKFYKKSQAMKTWAKFKKGGDDERQNQKFDPTVERIIKLADDQGVRRVLDIGCGNGVFLTKIKRRRPGIDVIGIESNPQARKIAEKGGVKFVEGIRDFRRKYLTADIVTAWGLLEHVPSPGSSLLDEIYTLDPKRLFICVPNVESDAVQTLGAECSTFCPQHLSYFNVETLKWSLHKSGFQLFNLRFIETEEIPIAKKRLGLKPYQDYKFNFMTYRIEELANEISCEMLINRQYKIIAEATPIR